MNSDTKGWSAEGWKDFPDYILGITHEIWEERGLGKLHRYYAPDIVMRTPLGIIKGNEPVIAATMATIHEFPDRQLYGEDVIFSDDPEHGALSSHRLCTTGTHLRDGQFGAASGKNFTIRVIADCAARGEVIYDEWLVRDYGGIVRQLGMDPESYAAGVLEREERSGAAPAFLPEHDVDGGYHCRGNDNAWGQRYAHLLEQLMADNFHLVEDEYDRAVQGEYAGAAHGLGREDAIGFWMGLRSSFPSATFKVHHVIGMDGGMMSPRAAVRWSLDGTHDGWGSFGVPTGKRVHIFGASHAEFGPWGLRREYALYDEIAIWKQIKAQTG